VNQYKYVTLTSGHISCACLTCFNVFVGQMGEDELCSNCEEAGCDPFGDCQRDDVWD
jgi:hypothetical protein